MPRAPLQTPKSSNRPLVQQVGAGVACLNPAGELLMVRRGDNGLWDLPGGRVEVGEATESAARRDLQEETGLRAGPLRLLGVYGGPATLHTYPDGQRVAWVTVLYLCRQAEGLARAADDAAELGWFGLDRLPEPRATIATHYLEDIRTPMPL